MPRVSVIIPTYNRDRFVVKAVASVLNQSFGDYEILVVDDGSTDNTRFVLKEFEGNIRYIHQNNGGVSAARNTGIRSATGQWVAFLDSDDEWTSEYLEGQIRRADETPGVCMQTSDCRFTGLGGDTKTYFELNGALREFQGSDYLLFREPFRFVIEHGPWQVGATIFLRDAIKRAGIFDTSLRISEDFDLMARMALEGPFGLIREPLVNIYRREESIECLSGQAKDNPIEARKSHERIYEKLGRIKGLRSKERKSLNGIMSANRRAMGNLLLMSGNVKDARAWYRRAFLIHPCVRTFGRYLLSFCCTPSTRPSQSPQA